MSEKPDPDGMARRWAAKRAWHERQRALPLREKIRIVIELQHRQQKLNKTKIALGLKPVPMRVWSTEP